MIARWCRYCVTSVHTKITLFPRRTKEKRCPLTGILTYKITGFVGLVFFFIRFAGEIRINFMLVSHRVKLHQIFVLWKNSREGAQEGGFWGFPPNSSWRSGLRDTQVNLETSHPFLCKIQWEFLNPQLPDCPKNHQPKV